MGTARPVSATIVTGYNGNLYNLHNRNFYIPLKPSAGGTLGQPLGGGKYVGLYSDTVWLSGDSASSGFVDFTFNFDVSGFTPTEKLFLKDASLTITFGDIDFKPVIRPGRSFRESLRLAYADKSPLVIDQGNYGSYTAGFVETNDRTVTYAIGLAGLGITDDDVPVISAAGRLDVAARFSSHLTHNAGFCATAFSNTPETIDCALINPVPEPGTSLLLSIGALLRILPCRERKHVSRLGTETNRVSKR